ncbi:Long-chain-fatty-acid--CoA ligase [Leucoagaricus sp. SymC.cos]|nr:Long-chain-fatty-acid--CoA ligase [Leucoagaricus sp. SymC.cos]
MTDMYIGNHARLPQIPDNMSLAQFMLDCQHELRPTLKEDLPCFVDTQTGSELTISQLRLRTYGLANALASDYGIGENDRVLLLSPNRIDYPQTVWAIHRLGAIVACSNPEFSADELCHQLRTADITFMIVHSTVLEVSLQAAGQCGLSDDRIVLLDKSPHGTVSNDRHHAFTVSSFKNLPDLIATGLNRPCSFKERTLRAGEGKSKVALLFWSSGTTGTPKVCNLPYSPSDLLCVVGIGEAKIIVNQAVAISHYGIIANIIQMALHRKIGKTSLFSPGDKVIGVLPFYHVAGFLITVCLELSPSVLYPNILTVIDTFCNVLLGEVSSVYNLSPLMPKT